MHLPDTFRELKDIFMRAAPPDSSELTGEYLVDMLTIFPSFKRFSHCKVFYAENNVGRGHNELFGIKWGRFFIEETICRNIDQKRAAVINYNTTGNSPLIRGIRDQIRCIVREELYIGRFNYSFFGRLIFLGYFSLERLKPGLVKR